MNVAFFVTVAVITTTISAAHPSVLSAAADRQMNFFPVAGSLEALAKTVKEWDEQKYFMLQMCVRHGATNVFNRDTFIMQKVFRLAARGLQLENPDVVVQYITVCDKNNKLQSIYIQDRVELLNAIVDKKLFVYCVQSDSYPCPEITWFQWTFSSSLVEESCTKKLEWCADNIY